MDSFEWNKIIGAVLGTLLFVFIVREVASIVFHTEEPEQLAYQIEIPEGPAEAAGDEQPEVVDFGALLREASAERGESVAKRCLQCHSFEKGGPNKTGPNLWGILGAEVATKPEFNYSNALNSLGGEWTYKRLYEYLAAPSRYAPGTNMNFAGLRRQSERIDLLAYLRTQADNPPPIPEPLPEETEEAEGGAAAQGAGTDGGTEAAPDTETPTEEGAPAEETEAAPEEGGEGEEAEGNGSSPAAEEADEGDAAGTEGASEPDGGSEDDGRPGGGR